MKRSFTRVEAIHAIHKAGYPEAKSLLRLVQTRVDRASIKLILGNLGLGITSRSRYSGQSATAVTWRTGQDRIARNRRAARR
eukprot:scaffold9949_cov78-Skeletonema_dohrnii-CCMP3373.AAC.1